MEQPDLSSGLWLGRVFWAGEIMEPVLIRKNDEGNSTEYVFRNCSNSSPTEILVGKADVEVFDSALVARFAQERTGALKTYREVYGLGYEPSSDINLTLRGAGSMLEARRLDHEHVRVTTIGSTITILLVSSREAMRLMEPEVWEEPWGNQPQDSQIKRNIIWWELTRPGHLRVHSAVENFQDLESQGTEPAAGNEVNWKRVFEKDLEATLTRAAHSLLVVERLEHIDLAEAILELAITTSSHAELDVCIVEDGWKKKERLRLEEVASRGRYWSLVRFYDLAAIMPDRIAGKIRRNYLQSSDTRGIRFAKDYVVLGADSQAFQVANAIYQDQAAGMAKMMNFLSCLVENSHEASRRLEILTKGLKRLNISIDRPGMPETSVSELIHPTDSPYAEAQQVKNRARIALKEAIYAGGAMHTRRKIEKGHEQLDRGNAFLSRSNGTNEVVLKEAIRAFKKAEEFFLKAKESAFIKEHSKPSLRVH
jgi:hypothetical protein